MKLAPSLQAVVRWLLLFVDPRKIISWSHLPRYMSYWRQFQSLSSEKLRIADSYPCLVDWVSSTPFDPHYFYQGAWLARKLAAERSGKHVDIGSDIRMINVLSAFIPTEFLDYRPLQVTLSGLTCKADNLLALSRADGSIDSLSCLHVIEHVGLGRYGDPIDPEGSRKAAAELKRVLAPGGRLYVSVPVGRERVCFNAHRVFDPDKVAALFPGLRLEAFSFVDDAGAYHETASTQDAAGSEYACGMYMFSKVS
jgi:SAM-dependent methyltransferase